MLRLCRACRHACIGTSLVVWALTILMFSGCFFSFGAVNEAACQAVTPLLSSACCNQIRTPLSTEGRR